MQNSKRAAEIRDEKLSSVWHLMFAVKMLGELTEANATYRAVRDAEYDVERFAELVCLRANAQAIRQLADMTISLLHPVATPATPTAQHSESHHPGNPCTPRCTGYVSPYPAGRLAEHVLAMRGDAYFAGHPEWSEIVADALEVLADQCRPNGDPLSWEQRVQVLENEGLTRSDAQGVVDAEDAKAGLCECGTPLGPDGNCHWHGCDKSVKAPPSWLQRTDE
jgi:hypothetical protein